MFLDKSSSYESKMADRRAWSALALGTGKRRDCVFCLEHRVDNQKRFGVHSLVLCLLEKQMKLVMCINSQMDYKQYLATFRKEAMYVLTTLLNYGRPLRSRSYVLLYVKRFETVSLL